MTTDNELDQMIEEALAPDAPEVHAWLDYTGPFTIAPGVLAADREHAEREMALAAAPPWEIDGERTAEWCARRALALEDERAVAKAEAARLRAVADEYEARVIHRTEPHLQWFNDRLKAWHAGILAQYPKRKTIDLPSGKLERRVGSVSVDITDPEALRAWLEERDDAETFLEFTDPKIRKAPISKEFGAKVDPELPGAYPAFDPATGEIIPGVHIVRGEPSEKFRPIAPSAEADE